MSRDRLKNFIILLSLGLSFYTQAGRTSAKELRETSLGVSRTAQHVWNQEGIDMDTGIKNTHGNIKSTLSRIGSVIAGVAVSAVVTGVSLAALSQNHKTRCEDGKVTCSKLHTKIDGKFNRLELERKFLGQWTSLKMLQPGEEREKWEARLHLDTKVPTAYQASSPSEQEMLSSATRILLVPSTATHLRQMLQELFLAADSKFGPQDQKISQMVAAMNAGQDIDPIELRRLQLNFVVDVSRAVAASHTLAWADLFSGADANRLGFRALYSRKFIGMRAAERSLEELEQNIADPDTCPRKKDGDAAFQLYDYARQVYLMKYLDDFRFGESFNKPGQEIFDRLGYNSTSNRLAIVERGRTAPEGQGEGEVRGIGHPGGYNTNFNIVAKFVLDFNQIEGSSVAVERITPEMDDWQKDWAKSAALRFRIDGRLIDVYFPTHWSNFDPNLTGSIRSPLQQSRLQLLAGTNHSNNRFISHPDGIVYFNSQKERVPNQFLVSASDAESNSEQAHALNEGDYELQTPYILKAFQDRPLHAVWTVGQTLGHNGMGLSRWVGGNSKDAIPGYRNIKEAQYSYEFTQKFEMLWEGRSPFFPGANNIDVKMHGSASQYLPKALQYTSPCTSLSEDSTSFGVNNPQDFRVLLEDASSRTPFTWEDHQGACDCSDWHAHYHKQGRSRWAVEADQSKDRGLKYSNSKIDFDETCSSLIGSPYCPKNKMLGQIRNAFTGPDAKIELIREGNRFAVKFPRPITAAEFKLTNKGNLEDYNFSYRLDKQSEGHVRGFYELSGTLDPTVGLDIRVSYVIEDSWNLGVTAREFNSKAFSLIPVTELDSLSASRQELAMILTQSSFEEETSQTHLLSPSQVTRDLSQVVFDQVDRKQPSYIKASFADLEEGVSHLLSFDYVIKDSKLVVFSDRDMAKRAFDRLYLLK